MTAEFGNGFSQANLFHMARFAEAFPDAKIVHALSAQLSWTHLRRIIYLDDPVKRDFYAESVTLAASLVAALRKTARAHAAGGQVAPFAVLWTDPKRLCGLQNSRLGE